MPYYCRDWKKEFLEVRIDPPGLRRRGDFFVVTGWVRNVGPCALRHTQLKLFICYEGFPKPLLQDVFHLTRRALPPGAVAPFRVEGEYSPTMLTEGLRVELWLVEDGRQ